MQKTRTSKPFRCILMSESKVEPHYFIFLTIITLIVTSFEVYVPRNFNKNFEDNTVRIIRKVFNENWNYRMRSTFYVFLNNYLKVVSFFPPSTILFTIRIHSSRDTLNDIRGNQWYFLLRQMFLFSPRLSSQMNLFQRLLDIRICFSSNRIMPSSSTPLAWALYCSEPVRSIAPNSLWQRNRWAAGFFRPNRRWTIASDWPPDQRISDRTRVDCTNVVAAVAVAIVVDAVDENAYPLDGRAVGVTHETCR